MLQFYPYLGDRRCCVIALKPNLLDYEVLLPGVQLQTMSE